MSFEQDIGHQISIEYVRLVRQFWIDKGESKEVLDNIIGFDVDQIASVSASMSDASIYKLHDRFLNADNFSQLEIEMGGYIARQAFIFNELFTYAKNIRQALNDLSQYPLILSKDARFHVTPIKQGIVVCCTSDCVTQGDSSQAMIHFIHLSQLLKIIFDFEVECLDQSVRFGQLGEVCHQLAQTDVRYLDKVVLVGGRYPQLFIPEKNLFVTNISWNKRRYSQVVNAIKKQALRRQKNIEMYDQLKQVLKQAISEEKIMQGYVADRLGVSVRNMQRQLKLLGTSYQEILDSVRKEAVIELINDQQKQSFTELAHAVGFNDVSAFYKAFRRWTGLSPGEYRQGMMLEQADLEIILEPAVQC